MKLFPINILSTRGPFTNRTGDSLYIVPCSFHNPVDQFVIYPVEEKWKKLEETGLQIKLNHSMMKETREEKLLAIVQ